MSNMNIDVPLEDVIKAKRQNRKSTRNSGRNLRRRSGGGPRSSIGKGGSKRLAQGSSKPTLSKSAIIPKTKEGMPVGNHSKVIVSNLPPDVTEQQIRELFNQTVGPLSEVNLHYDHKGDSKGIAQLKFKKAGDGNKAFKAYNGRLIDQTRPIKVEIVVETGDRNPLADRLGPRPATATSEKGGNTKSTPGKRGRRQPLKKRQPRRKGDKRPAKSADDLDAEMEDYTQQSAANKTE